MKYSFKLVAFAAILSPFMFTSPSVAQGKAMNSDDFFGAPVFHIDVRDEVMEVCRYNKTNGLVTHCETFEGTKKTGSHVTPVSLSCQNRTYNVGGKTEAIPENYVSATGFYHDLFNAVCKGDHAKEARLSGTGYHGSGHLGRWGNVSLPGSCKTDSEGGLVIGKNSFNRYEDICKVKSWKNGDKMFTFAGSCEVEGEPYSPSVKAQMLGDNILMTVGKDGIGDVYRRCSK